MKIHFRQDNGPIDQKIRELIDLAAVKHHPQYVRDMILTALKSGQEIEDQGDMKIMNTTLKEMRFTSKVFSPYRDIKKVSVFGSARTKSGEPLYELAKQCGGALVEAGYMVITGGGPGAMQAANEGAGPEKSFGVNIQLPFEQKPNPVIEGNPRYINYKYFFNRKVAFLKESHAIVLFPGGFGTLDEAMETLTLVQTGKRYPLPLVLMDKPDGSYWKRWLAFIKNELLKRGYINATDFNIFYSASDVADAVDHISYFYSRYHSMRYVGDKLVMRLQSHISENDLARIREDFQSSLVKKGKIIQRGALSAEDNEPQLAHLPRLVLDFNPSGFGRLRKLIDEINASEAAPAK